MDLKISSANASPDERSAVDDLLGANQETSQGGERNQDGLRVSRGGELLRNMRHLLLPTLHAVNDRIGWISRGAINVAYCVTTLRRAIHDDHLDYVRHLAMFLGSCLVNHRWHFVRRGRR